MGVGIALKAWKKLKFEEQEAAYEGDQLIYEYPPAKYTAEQIIKILLDPIEEKICPTSLTKSATYVVDVRSLQNIEWDLGFGTILVPTHKCSRCTWKLMGTKQLKSVAREHQEIM